MCEFSARLFSCNLLGWCRLRCRLVAALLHENVENLAFLVDSPPHEHAFATDRDDHLVEMPHAIGSAAPASDVRRDRWSELVRPATNCLIGNVDSTLGEQVLDVPQAHREPKIEPHCVAYDLRRKAMTLERDELHSSLLRQEKSQSGDALRLD